MILDAFFVHWVFNWYRKMMLCRWSCMLNASARSGKTRIAKSSLPEMWGVVYVVYMDIVHEKMVSFMGIVEKRRCC
jgi:hypothetical protein